jgi:hypothetical protein
MTERIGDAMFRPLDRHEAANLLGGTAAPSPTSAITFNVDGSFDYVTD